MKRIALRGGLGAPALLLSVLACSASGPALDQPVGVTPIRELPRPPAQEEIEPAVVVVQAPERDASENSSPYFTLCDLPDTVSEAPHFPLDSVELRPRGKQILDQIVNCMLHGELKGKKIIVLGYADPRGGERYNLDLAMARANRVAVYLVRRGVPAVRVSVASRGEHYARGAGPEGWHSDRRVEIELDDGETVGAL